MPDPQSPWGAFDPFMRWMLPAAQQGQPVQAMQPAAPGATGLLQTKDPEETARQYQAFARAMQPLMSAPQEGQPSGSMSLSTPVIAWRRSQVPVYAGGAVGFAPALPGHPFGEDIPVALGQSSASESWGETRSPGAAERQQAALMGMFGQNQAFEQQLGMKRMGIEAEKEKTKAEQAGATERSRLQAQAHIVGPLLQQRADDARAIQGILASESDPVRQQALIAQYQAAKGYSQGEKTDQLGGLIDQSLAAIIPGYVPRSKAPAGGQAAPSGGATTTPVTPTAPTTPEDRLRKAQQAVEALPTQQEVADFWKEAVGAKPTVDPRTGRITGWQGGKLDAEKLLGAIQRTEKMSTPEGLRQVAQGLRSGIAGKMTPEEAFQALGLIALKDQYAIGDRPPGEELPTGGRTYPLTPGIAVGVTPSTFGPNYELRFPGQQGAAGRTVPIPTGFFAGSPVPFSPISDIMSLFGSTSAADAARKRLGVTNPLLAVMHSTYGPQR